MQRPSGRPLYQHRGVGLLRAAAATLDEMTEGWPDLSDVEACRAWLNEVWSRPDLAEAIRQASPGLGDRVDAIRAGHTVTAKRLHRAALTTVRYVLRATGRHTPFGLFAGVAPTSVGAEARVRWGDGHRPVARADSQWLADVVGQLEAHPELLERLDVVFTDLSTQRGGRLEAPHGPNRVTVRRTSALQAVRDAAASPVRFGVVADKLTGAVAGADPSRVCGMLTDLVRQGLLITCLHAPLTVTDPLSHLLGRLREVDAGALPAVAPLLGDLEAIQVGLDRHNGTGTGSAAQERCRVELTRRMRALSQAGRTALAVDLRLDCEVRLPEHVLGEAEWAASALVRLTRQPTGEAPWRDFYVAFCGRYGTGTLVPLGDVVDPDTGLGLPHGYPGSVLPPPSTSPSERDGKLLALAWQAMAEDSTEITLDEDSIRSLTVGDPAAEFRIPPHVELTARIQAADVEALDRGDYTVTVAPGRSAGTFTSRFTCIAAGSGLEEVYAGVPTVTEGALPVQLSFPPVYAHAENVCRVPAYLRHTLSLGEHRVRDETTIPLDDLAVTATRDGLHLVSVSRQRVVEPQAFHALALDKQPPPLARFLAHLSRGLGAAWHEFDWGPHAHPLPYLPRVRYRRAVLSPARWRLSSDDLPTGNAGSDGRRQALDRWRVRWRCPADVELRDADRTLRLDLDEPSHVALVHAHLARHGHVVFTEAVGGADAYGWIGGHAHEIAVPLYSTRPAGPSPMAHRLVPVTNRAHGQLPGSPDAAWLYAKVHTHPDRFDEIIAQRLPRLVSALDGEPAYWFVRYRSPHETDHLRLRIRTPDPERQAACVAAVAAWARHLQQDGLAGRLVLDTYHPETGRYGDGDAMDAAESVFHADSRAVVAQLRRLPAGTIEPRALTALNLVGTVQAFLGGLPAAIAWLIALPAAPAAATGRSAADQVVKLARSGMLHDLPGWQGEVANSWQARATALAHYRTRLPADSDVDSILGALLHMHHNRALGIDPDGEAACRLLARKAALAWSAQREGDRR